MVLGAYSYFLWYLNGQLPVLWSDEWLYLINTKAFYEWGTVQAAITYDGWGSTWFGADSHGPLYPIIHGGIAMLFSWNPANFLWLNLLLFLLTALGYFCANIPNRKEWIGLLLLHPLILFYSFSLMQEMIHVCGAMIASILLIKLSERGKRSKFKIYFVFLAFLLVFSLFRSSWMIWGIALLPFLPKRFPLISKLIGLLGLFVISLGIQLAVTESVPTHFATVVEFLTSGELAQAVKQVGIKFFKNLGALMLYSEGKAYYLIKIGMLIQFAGLIYLYTKRKTKILQVGVLVFGTHLLLLLLFYEASGWIELRILFAPGLLVSYLLFQELRRTIRWGMIGFQLLVFVGMLPNVNQAVYWRLEQKHRLKVLQEEKIMSAINQLPLKHDYWIKIEAALLEEIDFDQLPLGTFEGSRIHYIAPFYTKNTKTPDVVIKSNPLRVSVNSITP